MKLLAIPKLRTIWWCF